MVDSLGHMNTPKNELKNLLLDVDDVLVNRLRGLVTAQQTSKTPINGMSKPTARNGYDNRSTSDDDRLLVTGPQVACEMH